MFSKIRHWLWNQIVQWLLTETSTGVLSPLNFPRLIREIRPADVLLVEGRHRVSNVIKAITQSPWSHSSLYIGSVDSILDPVARELISRTYYGPSHEPLVIESELGSGVIVSPLSKYENHHVRICRAKGLSGEDAQRVISHAIQYLGSTYDVRQLLDLARFLFPFWSLIPRKWRSSLFEHNAQNPTSMVCSSIIASAFYSIHFPILPLIVEDKYGGYKLHKRNLRLYTPRDFDYSPYFEIIKYPLMGDDDVGFYRKLIWENDSALQTDLIRYIEAYDVLHIKDEILRGVPKDPKHTADHANS